MNFSIIAIALALSSFTKSTTFAEEDAKRNLRQLGKKKNNGRGPPSLANCPTKKFEGVWQKWNLFEFGSQGTRTMSILCDDGKPLLVY